MAQGRWVGLCSLSHAVPRVAVLHCGGLVLLMVPPAAAARAAAAMLVMVAMLVRRWINLAGGASA